MVSILSQPPFFATAVARKDDLSLNELGSLREAQEPFIQLICRSNQPVRLYCTVPTWSPSETCRDLHDLHELSKRFLVFVHDVLQSLRAAGISADYRLTPSNSPLCVVCALPLDLCSTKVQHAAVEALQNAQLLKRNNVLLADLEYGPAVVIS